MTEVVMILTAVVVGGIIGIGLALSGAPSLKDCALEHNVYQCEWIAVPVKTEPRP